MEQAGLSQKTTPDANLPKKKTEDETQEKENRGTEPQENQHEETASDPGKQHQGTPYDDVFRTLLKDCTTLLFPIVNEMFGENYTGKETIEFHPNEHFLKQQDGKEGKRITDSSFTISGAVSKHYLLELQSTPDNSMLIRIFEYSTQIALEGKKFTGDTLRVTIPHCGILFLRSTGNTPDRMQIQIDTPGGSVSFDVQVMKTQKYTIDELFEKNLLMLIPYYIFAHEKKFEEYNTDDDKLEELKTEYSHIVDRLKDLAESKQISEYQHRAILELSGKVLRSIAAKYDKVKKGVEEIMTGGIIETEASKIYHEGEAHGIAIGEARGIAIGKDQGIIIGKNQNSERTAVRLHVKGHDPVGIADILEVDIQQVRKWIRKGTSTD